MRKTFLVMLFFMQTIFATAQEMAVDSKGEPVFQFYSLEDARLQLTRRAPLSASYLFNIKGAKQDAGMLVQLSLLNSGDFPMIEKLRDIRPGVGIKLGYQKTVGTFSNANSSKNVVHAWGINGFFNVDNIKLYDTLEGLTEKKYPVTYGAEGNYTLFFGNKNGNHHWRKALSFYTALSSTWNDRNLLSYQQISKVTIRPDVVAMQDFDGKYGALKNNFFKYRMAASFPMFYKRFNPTPYVVAIFGTQNSPSYHMGVFTNIMASSLKKAGEKMPCTFGLGFDWVYATEHLSSKVNLFLKVAVSLGKLKEDESR
jgi:hypothetical protein